jgi:NADPH-dependent 2,4-dienoyl-CoA reductase/sulfur reductase-like enzyme/rhodanese-related sulfurtransferase
MMAMDRSDFVIIGGVAAGPKTAATLKRRLPNATVTLFQKDELLSYASCGIPYFVSGDLSTFDELTRTAYGVKRDADFFRSSRGFEAVTKAEVTCINREAKTVTVQPLPDGQSYEFGYGKLVLATGATPVAPPFPVASSDLIRTMHTPGEAIAFRRLAEQGKVGSAVIIGGSFVGCELAEALGSLWGIDVTVIEKEGQLLPGMLDGEMAALVEQELRQQGVTVITEAHVERIDVSDSGSPVVALAGHKDVPSDYAFLALGLRPQVSLAKACGLVIGPSGGIAVNARMQTSDPDIYAGGDCVESTHQITGEKLTFFMGSVANRHGRAIAENLAGGNVEFPGIVGSRLLKVYDANAGAVGLSERDADRTGIKAHVVWGTFPDKPDYLPNSKRLTLKMLYEPGNRRLLGLQAVGDGDICRRIDVFSSFLQRRATISDLLDFEHGYMPAYSEALDPLHHLAALAEAQERGERFLGPQAANGTLASEPTLVLDVREDVETEAAPLPAEIANSGVAIMHIPLHQIRERLGEISNGRRIVVLCQRGPRSYVASLILKTAKLENVTALAGGLEAVAP